MKPFLYAHELLDEETKEPKGIYLACDSLEITKQAHIEGETSEEITVLYHEDDVKQLLQQRAELLEALKEILELSENLSATDRPEMQKARNIIKEQQ